LTAAAGSCYHGGLMSRPQQHSSATAPLSAATDLPSPYQPDSVFGLLHLPRFLAKIRLQLRGQLPAAYARNFAGGFDALLCLHLGIEPGEVIALARAHPTDSDFYSALHERIPSPPSPAEWNRHFAQLGLSGTPHEQLETLKAQLGLSHRQDLRTFADLIDFDEGRLN
jgi:hypothetical protein